MTTRTASLEEIDDLSLAKHDIFAIFIKEAGKYPILDREEEQKRARKLREKEEYVRQYIAAQTSIPKGKVDGFESLEEDFIRKIETAYTKIQKSKLVEGGVEGDGEEEDEEKREESEELIDQLLLSDPAYQKDFRNFTSCYLRFLPMYAKKFTWTNIPIMDLIQEGSFGLSRATKFFDPERGNIFETYAKGKILQSIRRYIQNSGSIRIPVYLQDAVSKYRVFCREYREKNEKEATRAEILEGTGIKPETFETVLEITEQWPTAEQSLDQPLDRHSDKQDLRTLVDNTTSPSLSPEEEVIMSETHQALREAIEQLTPGEQRAVRGFMDDESNGDIGRRESPPVKKDTIRLRIESAMQKLRRAPRIH